MAELIKKVDSLNDGRKKLNNAITAFNETVVEGDSSVEAAQARVDEEGQAHDTLKDRIDDGFTKTKTQLADTATKEELQDVEYRKMDKNTTGIGLHQIDKNKGLINESYLSDELKQQMAGNTPIHSTPANKSITNNKYADRSVHPETTSFISKGSNLFNIDAITDGKIIGGDGEINDSQAYSYSDFIHVEPSATYYQVAVYSVAEYDANLDFIRRFDIVNKEGDSFTVGDQVHYIRVNLQVANIVNYGKIQVNKGNSKLPYEDFRLEVKGLKLIDDNIGNNSIDTNKIKDEGIESSKRTVLGEIATCLISANADYPNIDTNANTVTFYGTFFIVNRNERIMISNDTIVNLDGTGAHQHVLYNVKERSFRSLSSSKEDQIKESETRIMTINRRASTVFINVFCTFPYTINGVDPIKEKILETVGGVDSKSEMFFSISNEKLGWYYPDENETYNDFDYGETTYNQAIAKFLDLAQEHNGYIDTIELGKDTSVTYDMYRFRLVPEVPEVPSLDKPIPKIIVACGLHAGTEKESIFSLYYFMKQLCENWQNDETLEYLRHNVEFDVIPIVNPWGFDGGDFRRNSNLVDLNRNFSYKWRSGTEGSDTYGGTSAFSEVESQYVRDMISDNPDAMYFCDYHTNGSSGNVYDTLMWIPLNDKPFNNENLNNASRYVLSKCTREFIKRYGQPDGEGFFGYVSNNTTEGSAKAYASSQGIPASTLECFRKFPNQEDLHNPNAVKACTEYFSNFIINIIKQFKVNNIKRFS